MGHWEKYPLHLSANDQRPLLNSLPEHMGPENIAEMVRRSGHNLKMFKKGDSYDGDDFYSAYLDGASLIVNQADRASPLLMGLCRGLADLFLHVFAVAYLTPPESHAVRLHSDDQDVFLMQVWGSKEWKIRNSPTYLPYTEEMLGKGKVVPPSLVEDPIMEFTMKAGDILFIPRGFLHEANTGFESSLHITITMPTSDYCWGVLVGKHFMETLHSPGVPRALLDTTRMAMSANPTGLGNVAPEDDAALDAQISALLEHWGSSLSSGAVVEAFEGRMKRTNSGQEVAHSKAMSMPLRPSIVAARMRVRLMPGIKVRIAPDNSCALFQRGEQSLELPIRPTSAGVLRELTSTPKLVAELPCEDHFERLCILEILIQRCCVQLFLKEAEKNDLFPAPLGG